MSERSFYKHMQRLLMYFERVQHGRQSVVAVCAVNASVCMVNLLSPSCTQADTDSGKSRCLKTQDSIADTVSQRLTVVRESFGLFQRHCFTRPVTVIGSKTCHKAVSLGLR